MLLYFCKNAIDQHPAIFLTTPCRRADALCLLPQTNSSQSAKKAAHLRAKFEKWETEVERQNEINKPSAKDEIDGEAMPSLDTARNLRAMFESKAKEDNLPLKKAPTKVNRFVVS